MAFNIPIEQETAAKVAAELRKLPHVEIDQHDRKGLVKDTETGITLFTFEHDAEAGHVIITPIDLPADISEEDMKARLLADIETLKG